MATKNKFLPRLREGARSPLSIRKNRVARKAKARLAALTKRKQSGKA